MLLSSAKGIFTRMKRTRFSAIQGYSVEAVDFLLGLMERFELSFPLPGPRQQILIPQLLDDQQPSAADRLPTQGVPQLRLSLRHRT